MSGKKIFPGADPRVFPSDFANVVGVASDAGSMGVIGSNPDDGAFGLLAGKDLVPGIIIG